MSIAQFKMGLDAPKEGAKEPSEGPGVRELHTQDPGKVENGALSSRQRPSDSRQGHAVASAWGRD